ncbi:MAG: hypothetical protein ACYC7L_15835 [Nitrospirota bacterium]
MAMNTKRKSLCVGCGKRLSAITSTGDIRWKPSQVNDEGLYCEDCYNTIVEPKGKKGVRPQHNEKHG